MHLATRTAEIQAELGVSLTVMQQCGPLKADGGTMVRTCYHQGKPGEGGCQNSHHLGNLSAHQKLLQKKMLIKKKKKLQDSWSHGLTLPRKRNRVACGGRQEGESAPGGMMLDLHPGGNRVCLLKSLMGTLRLESFQNPRPLTFSQRLPESLSSVPREV